jgi:hypothetical protein
VLWRVEYEVHAAGLMQANVAYVSVPEQVEIHAVLAREANREIVVRRMDLIGTQCFSGAQQFRMWREPRGLKPICKGG